jgi:hypothetical protein
MTILFFTVHYILSYLIAATAPVQAHHNGIIDQVVTVTFSQAIIPAGHSSPDPDLL